MLQKYSAREALNRIFRSFAGIDVPTDVPETLTGDILSEDSALSNMAELFEGSLPGYSGVIPPGINLVIDSFVEYGGIYTSITGTSSVTLNTGFQKVTGAFQANMVYSDHVTPDSVNGKITITKTGIYFVGTQLSFSGTANATITCGVAMDGVVQNQLRVRRKLGASGDVGSASFAGIVQVTGTPVVLDLRARCDLTTKTFALETGQIWVYGVTQQT